MHRRTALRHSDAGWPARYAVVPVSAPARRPARGSVGRDPGRTCVRSACRFGCASATREDTGVAGQSGAGEGRLLARVQALRAAVSDASLPLDLPGAPAARSVRTRLLDQLDDYIIP